MSDDEGRLDQVISALKQDDEYAGDAASHSEEEAVKVSVKAASGKKGKKEKESKSEKAARKEREKKEKDAAKKSEKEKKASAEAAKKTEKEVPKVTPKVTAQLPGPPAGPPPTGSAKRPLPGPPKEAPPPEVVALHQEPRTPNPSMSFPTQPREDSYEKTNKLYYSKFEDESRDVVGELMELGDSKWLNRLVKAFFGLLIVGGVAFGVVVFAEGVQNWHMQCDVAIDLMFVVLGFLMAAEAGVFVMMAATKGVLRRVMSWLALATAVTYATFLCVLSALAYNGVSQSFSFGCDASGSLGTAKTFANASWAVLSTLVALVMIRFGVKRAKSQYEEREYARLQLSDVNV